MHRTRFQNRLLTTPDARQPKPARGFTLFELLIATAVIGLILASVIPYVMATRELSRRAQCASNLKLVRDAMKVYAADFGTYPRVRYDSTVRPEGWTAFTGADASDPFAAGGAVQPNDVTASIWLLVRNGYVSDTGAFVCPSTGDWPDRLYDAAGAKTSAKRRGNFRSPNHLSYSIFCPFGSAVQNWTDTLPSDCALLADKSPGVGRGNNAAGVPATAPAEAYAVSNSPNHGRAGQNVLFADGSVQFERNSYVGVGYKRPMKNEQTGEWSTLATGDNIYTAEQATPLPAGQTPPAYGQGVVSRDVSPAWPYDSYLVPTAAE